MTDPGDPRHQEARAGWDVVARGKYAGEFDDHVAHLGAGGHNLLEEEEAELRDLLPGRRVIQLQCSHGLDALGLLNAGAASVVGIDISEEMIAQARAKARAVGADGASFLRADVVEPPAELHGTADLVYTGRGSLPWILDLPRWAAAVRRLLRPGGSLYLFEGHPLADLWDREAHELRLRPGVSYFDERAREVTGFPAGVVRRTPGGDGPRLRERHWRPGQVIGALIHEGLELRSFREHPRLFWNQLPHLPEEVRRRLPQSYSILARSPGPGGRDEPSGPA